MGESYALVGDIGGTNCRLALVRTDEDRPVFHAPRNMRCVGHDSFDAALHAYLDEAAAGLSVDRAVLAVAGPVVDGRVDMTNHPWTVSEAALAAATGGAARLINDYAALAYAAPALAGEDLRAVGPVPGTRVQGTIAVLGAGTGFGVSALVRDDGREAALVGEGGHVAFAPNDEVEAEVLRILRARFGRVSIERILSGPGLLSLHQALSDIEGVAPAYETPDAVTAAAAAQEPRAVNCTERFCAILGSVAGDFALAYGARGGVQIAGGVSQLLLATPAAAAFRPRFEDKGRLSYFVRAIPTEVVLHPQAALVGAARALATLGDAG
jgi:glucokinase